MYIKNVGWREALGHPLVTPSGKRWLPLLLALLSSFLRALFSVHPRALFSLGRTYNTSFAFGLWTKNYMLVSTSLLYWPSLSLTSQSQSPNGLPWEGFEFSIFYLSLLREIEIQNDQMVPVCTQIWMLRSLVKYCDIQALMRYSEEITNSEALICLQPANCIHVKWANWSKRSDCPVRMTQPWQRVASIRDCDGVYQSPAKVSVDFIFRWSHQRHSRQSWRHRCRP